MSLAPSPNNGCNKTTSNLSLDHLCLEKSPGSPSTTSREILKIVYTTIAIVSFTGNVLLCVIVLRKKMMLKRSYNVLILNLAVADALTGTNRTGS